MSEELAGNPANYEVKLNFRREQDYEVRREGWEFFKPFVEAPWIASQDANYKDAVNLEGTLPLTLAADVVRKDLRGQSLLSNESILNVAQIESRERITVAATRSKLYILNKDPTNPISKYSNRYFDVVVNEDGTEEHYLQRFDDPMKNYVGHDPTAEEFRDSLDAWTDITPSEFDLSLDGDRIDIDQLNGHVVFNNGRDLPCVFHSDWMNASPIYELREKGIVSAKVVAQFNGLLLLADVEEFEQKGGISYLQVWDENCDDVGFYGCVKDSDAYRVGKVKTVRVPYRVWYSNPGAPSRWGVVYESKGALENGALSFTSKLDNVFTDTPSRSARSTFYPGCVVRIAAFDTPEGEVVNIYNYRTITSITGNEFILDKPLDFSYLGTEVDEEGEQLRVTFDKANCYMDRVDHVTDDDTQMVSADGFSLLGGISNGASFFDPVSDGTAIIAMERLKDRLVVFRSTGYGILSAYDNAGASSTVAPFTFEQRYTGSRTPIDRFTVVAVNDRQLLYAGKEDLYSISISFSEPDIPLVLDVAKEFGYGDSFFMTENVLTNEVFICGSRKTFAYDYKFQTVSEVDEVFTCAKSIKDPVTGLNIFVMGIRQPIVLKELRNLGDELNGQSYLTENPRGCALFKYSYDEPSDLELSEYHNNKVPYDPSGKRKYVREAVEDYEIVGKIYDSVLESGWIDFGNRLDEKDFRMYLMSFQCDPASFYIKERKGDSQSALSLPFVLPSALPLDTFRNFEEERLALDGLDFELPQAPRLRVLADENYHLTVKLYSRDSVGGVHRLEVKEILTDRDEVSIPVWFRSVFFKDRVELTGVDSGRVLARTVEASLVASGGRILTIDK